jgi:NAD(P)-dependent dehydrogenase (short-subunit alcohol dehydrogenase family)
MPSVLITGCSSGFGLEAAISLAERGWRVFATMRNLDKRDRLDGRAKDAGVNLDVLQLDVTDAASIERAVSAVGPLGALVNNAGVSSGGAFEDVPEEEFRRIFETNFFGVLALTRAVLPAMRERRRGRIVVVSSDSAYWGAPALSAYSASKWAVTGWAGSLAEEVRPFGIHVVSIEPGSFKTDIWDSSPRIKPDGSAYAGMVPIVEKFVDETLIPKGGDPKEVGEAIADSCDSPRPKLRQPVGKDAKALSFITGVVPDRAFYALVRRVSGLHKWKP